MSVAQYQLRSCSAFCTARPFGRLRHCHNAVRSAFGSKSRGFCTQRSTDQASPRPIAAGSGSIADSMLAGLKKAFTKVWRMRYLHCCPSTTPLCTHLTTLKLYAGACGVHRARCCVNFHRQWCNMARIATQSPATSERAAVGDTRPRERKQTPFLSHCMLCHLPCLLAIVSAQGPANARGLKRTFGKGKQPVLKLYRCL